MMSVQGSTDASDSWVGAISIRCVGGIGVILRFDGVTAEGIAQSVQSIRAGLGTSLNNTLTMTGPMISRFGLASALVLLPAASAVGFAVVGTVPILLSFILFTIVRRIGEYAVAKPAREVLFTVLSPEEKYKAKNFIDTAVSRAGDAATGWIVKAVKSLGVEATHMAWTLIPLSVVWACLGWWLAKQEERKRLERAR